MTTKLHFILISFLFCLGLAGCNDDFLDSREPSPMPMAGNVGVQFEIFDPEEGNTRGSETPKTRFQEGDVIHIEATFTNDDNQQGTAYGCMRLMAGKWQQVEGSNLIWPFVATRGEFKAFYMPQSDGVLLPGTPTDAVLLSELDASYGNTGYDLDPLEAVSESYKYGHAVELHFTHALTHLTFTNMDTGISDFFWLVRNNSPEDYHNAYSLVLGADNRLQLVFERSERGMYGEDTEYIAAKAVGYMHTNDDGVSSQRVKASYFLEPGDYSQLELRTSNNTPYLSLNSSETEDLLPDIPYVIDVMKSNGVTFIIKDDDSWDDSDPEYEVVVKDFIEAAVNGNDYTVQDKNTGEDVGILEAINNGVRLLRSVRFPDDQQEYDRIWNASNTRGFAPNIPAGRVFEGDHHYISNLRQPLFQYNAGTIQNLGLKGVDCEVVSKYVGQDNDYRADRSRRGGLCQWNREGGLIYNIRVENMKLTVNVEGGSSTHTHSAGGITGVNIGTIRDIYLDGNIEVIMQNNSNKASAAIDSEVALGGISGQNTGNIFRVSPLQSARIKVTNLCVGDGGVFSVGGAVGFCAGVLENVSLPEVEVDCSASDCYQSYTGGLTGRLRGSATSNLVSGCSVGGSVRSGIVSTFGEMTDSYLYIGGLAGSCASFKVTDCSTVVAVTASSDNLDGNARYATGGVFGSILAIDGNDRNDLTNLTGWNPSIQGPLYSGFAFVGCFSGIVPAGKTWGDYAGMGVTVKTIGSYPQIGVSMNIEAGGAS